MVKTDPLPDDFLARRIFQGVNDKLHATVIGETAVEEMANLDHSKDGLLITRHGFSEVDDDIAPTASERVENLSFVKHDSFLTVKPYLLVYVGPTSTPNFKAYKWNSTLGVWTNISGLTTTFFTSGKEIFSIQADNKVYFGQDQNGTILALTINAEAGAIVGTATGGATSANTSFPPGHIFANWLGRVWVAGNSIAYDVNGDGVADAGPSPNYVWFSAWRDAATWDRINKALKIGGFDGAGFQVIALLPIRNTEMIVFCDSALFRIFPIDSPFNTQVFGVPTSSSFGSDVIDTRVGCGARKTAALVGNDIIFMDQYGDIRSLRRTEAEKNQGAIGLPLSDAIQGTIDRINKDALSSCSAFVKGRKYYFFFPLDSATSPDTCMIYDITTGTWDGPHSFSFKQFAEGNVAGSIKGYSIDFSANLNAYEIEDGLNDNGISIPESFRSRREDFGQPNRQKKGRYLTLWFVDTDNTNVDVKVSIDGGADQLLGTMDLSGNAGTLPQTFPFFLGGAGITRKDFSLTDQGTWYDIQVVWEHDEVDTECRFFGYELTAQILGSQGRRKTDAVGA